MKKKKNKKSLQQKEDSILPVGLGKKVRALARKLGCTEGEMVAEMVHLVLNELDQPQGRRLRAFVAKAGKALQAKAPKK